MNGRFVIQIVLALILAATAGVLTLKLGSSRRVEAPVNEQVQNTVMIVVTNKEIVRGEKLSSEFLKLVPYLNESLPAQYFSDPAELNGRYVVSPLALNEPVTESRLAPLDAAGGISLLIEPGKRAITVLGNKVLGLAGFLRPGNRVDVLVTLEDQRLPTQVVTKTVLENIKVLATGTEMEENSQGEFSPVDTYTLEITPEEGEMLSLAATKGTLHFALRNPEDVLEVRTKGADIFGAISALRTEEVKKVVAAPVRAKAEPKPQAKVVEVIRGIEVSQVEF